MEAHIRQNHIGFEESQLPILIKMGEATSRASARSCPICLFDEPDRDRLQSHIAFHLESLASFALPRDRINLDGGSDPGGDLSHVANAESGSSEGQDLESLIPIESQNASSEQEEEVELHDKDGNNPSVSPATPKALEVPERNSVGLPPAVADFVSSFSGIPDPEQNPMMRGPSGQPEIALESESFPPLHRAVQAEDHDSVKRLLEAGCSKDAVDSHNRSAVYWAVEDQKSEDHEILNVLLEYGCSPDTSSNDGRTPLMNAIIHGYIGSARRLLKAKANVQSRDKSGYTPLHLAAAHGLEMVVEDLLLHGAEVNARNHFAETPLHTASVAARVAVVKALINHQADLTLRNSAGMTCLHLAARLGSPNVVAVLLENGATPDERGDFNQTALHMTAIGGYESVAYVLLAYHADVNLRDSNGKTAWDVAIKSGHPGLMKLLVPDQYKDIKTEVSFEMDAMMRQWLPSSNDDYPSFDEIRHISREVELNEMQVHAWFCKMLSKQVHDPRIENSSRGHDSQFHEPMKTAPFPPDRGRNFWGSVNHNRSADQNPIPAAAVESAVQFRGPEDRVNALESKILQSVDEQHQDDLERGYTVTFDFPQKFANHLIGTKGANIKALRDEFDVEINVGKDGKVTVRGPKVKAEKAKSNIVALGKKLEDEARYVIKVQPQYHEDLIGQKGKNVNWLQDRYNVRIQFPQSPKTSFVSDDHSVTDTASEVGGSRNGGPAQAPDEVVIRGPQQGASQARDELLDLLQWYVDKSYTSTIEVPQGLVPSLIGKGGREIQSIREDFDVSIDIPKTADASGRVEIKLKGFKKHVDEANKALAERVKVFDDTVTKTIDVDKKYHRALIGAGGKFAFFVVVNLR
jgi:ankyrin repeat protein/transcription antitermination factor NusA-like protein